MFPSQSTGSVEKVNYESIVSTIIYRINTAYANQDNQAYVKNIHCLKDLLSPYFSAYYRDVFKQIGIKREKDLEKCSGPKEIKEIKEILVESWREVYLILLKILKNKGLLLKERRGIPLK